MGVEYFLALYHSLFSVSNIAATGMYDPFTLDYAGWVFNLFNIPLSMMPRIVDSAGDHFGSTKPGTQLEYSETGR